jgi:hypothetical protein
MDNFSSIIDKLNEDYQQTIKRGSGEAYSKLSTIFEELGAYLREYVQGRTDDEIKTVLRKLRDGNQLSDTDLEIVRLWIVDDAAQYMKLENNFGDWQEELKRVISEITEYKKAEANVKNASELRGLFRDGARVLADIFFYLQQKDRVMKFEQASKQLGPQERALLIGLLEQKMKSREF